MIQTLAWQDVPGDLRRQCASLWARVWPHGLDLTSDGLDATTEVRLQWMLDSYDELPGHQFHIAVSDGVVVAVARTFTHTVSVIDKDGVSTARPVLALASVCSDPERRGEGWGHLVTEAALARTESEQLTALFQSGVQSFYERFGSRTIPNEVFTSAEGVDAFTDEVVMIHPGTSDWDDTARVDLQRGGW